MALVPFRRSQTVRIFTCSENYIAYHRTSRCLLAVANNRWCERASGQQCAARGGSTANQIARIVPKVECPFPHAHGYKSGSAPNFAIIRS
jgi:hypothetical protein